MILFQPIIAEQQYYQPFWITILILLSISIIGYVYFAYKTRLALITEAVFAIRMSTQLSREEHLLSNPASLLLNINFLICVPLFFLQTLSNNKLIVFSFEFNIKWFFILLIAILSIYFIKILFIKIIAFILKKEQIANEYIFSIFSFNQLIGILFIPIIILNAYSTALPVHILKYIGIGLLVFVYVLRVGKGTIVAFNSGQVTVFYLFLYFCTLEAMPLLFVWKLIN